LIHAIKPETIKAYLQLVKPEKQAFSKISDLRVLAGMEVI